MAAVVADTSVLIAFHQIQHLSVLERLFTNIHIPSSVAREAAPTLPELPSWVLLREPKQPIRAEIAQALLGPGERDVLALALDFKADLVLLDDRAARRLALRLELPVSGTAGILLRAKQAGLVPSVRSLVDALLRFDFHLSSDIRAKVLAAAGEEDSEQPS